MECNLRGSALLTAAILIGSTMTGCRSGDRPAPTQIPVTTNPGTTNPGTTNPATPGTGTLTVSVVDPEGRPLVGASVTVYDRVPTAIRGSGSTGTNGLATIGSVPAAASVHVFHQFGEYYRNGSVEVAQQGVTLLAVTLQAARPRPTVALLPVSIPAGSVSADRSELTLEITVVASAAAPFVPGGYGFYGADPLDTPYLALHLARWNEPDEQRECVVWLDRTHTVPSCNGPWGESPYTVSVQQFAYDPVGTVPMLASPGPAQSAMLIMDQSGRVSDLDPGATRSFAARQFIARAVTSSQPKSLSVAGFAGDGNDPAALPERPLWVPLAAGAVFTTDRAALDAAVTILEPLIDGSAPVFEALQAALTLTASEAPPGNRTAVALLGGGDDGDMSDSARQDALASLRRQRDATGIQFVLIAAAPFSQHREHLALAELSAALRAPAITLGVSLHSDPGFFGSYEQTWVRGSFAALDLAADLIDGLPLPTLSAVFRVKANRTGAFPPGATLHGLVFVASELCPWDCWELPLDFAVEIP